MSEPRREHRGGVDAGTDGERDQHHVAPTRVHRPPARRWRGSRAGRPDRRRRELRRSAERAPSEQEDQPRASLSPDTADLNSSNRGRASASGRPRSGRGTAKAVREPRVEITSSTTLRHGPGARTTSARRASPGRDLEIGDLLRSAARPRRRARSCTCFGLVVPAADQVEEGGDEFERAGRATLPDEGRHERRLGVSVGGSCSYSRSYPVSTSRPPAPEDEEQPQRQRREARREHEEDQRRAERVVESPPGSGRGHARYAFASARLVVDDPLASPAPLTTRAPAVDVIASERGYTVRSSTYWPAGTSIARRRAALPSRVYVAADRTPDGPRREQHFSKFPVVTAVSYGQPLLPLVTPDLDVDVDDVRVRDRDPDAGGR